MTETFYDILGVSEKSSTSDIKRAYRDLSLKYHPDRNSGNIECTTKFQKINEAYETLGDAQKKEEYDNKKNNPFFKMNGFGAGSTGGGVVNIDDLISSLFGFNDIGGNGGHIPFQMHPINHINPNMFHGGGSVNNGPNIRIFRNTDCPVFETLQKPTPIIKTIHINMEQVLNGGNIPIEIERWINENNLKIFENETLYVQIPQGIDDNEIIILKNKGNVLTEDCKGDVKLFIKIDNNTEFERQGLDLLINKTITLKEALCGFSFELKYINGKTYTLNNSLGNIIPPNYKKNIQNMGLTREGRIGNLIINFIVEFPEKIELSKIESLINIL